MCLAQFMPSGNSCAAGRNSWGVLQNSENSDSDVGAANSRPVAETVKQEKGLAESCMVRIRQTFFVVLLVTARAANSRPYDNGYILQHAPGVFSQKLKVWGISSESL